MNRRLVLKQLAMATTAAWLLPSCVADPKKVSIALNNLKVSGDEEELLAGMASTMIPETDTPGAKTVGAHLFALVMVDDCLDKSEQEKYLKGMRSFNDDAKELTGKAFTKASAEEKLSILKEVEKNMDKLSEETQAFYKTSKRFILQGYTSSQHYMTTINPYVHVPGPDFKGCLLVSEQKTPA